jgi:long-chain acyl-CoA synthetase
VNGIAHPWTAFYPSHVDADLGSYPRSAESVTAAWAQRVAEAPGQPAIRYFDLEQTVSEVDAIADALAVELEARGVTKGDRVGIQLQNVPQFAYSMLALWKLGAVPLILNTMYREHELTTIVNDAKPVGLISSETTAEDLSRMPLDVEIPWVLRTDDEDLHAHAMPDGLVTHLARNLGRRPRSSAATTLTATDPALLTYTSGTTGAPKGAVGTHGNLLAVAYGNQQWLDLRPGDVVLAVAPLFHITGAVATATTALTVGRCELVFVGRIRASNLLAALRDHHVQHILGSITVYNTLLDSEEAVAEDFSHVRTVFSGGAPVPPATVAKFQERFGHYIHNIYGMTETASAVIAVPLGQRARQDPASGTLAIGVPLPGLEARVVDLADNEVPTGETGELVLRGPQCMQHYLNRPDATSATIRDGWLHTGDVGMIDADGWIYLVDRQKDQINVSGYKVWPREVEDILYEHPDVNEAAVVGLPDPRSGERVVAFVSVHAGGRLDPDQLRAHVRQRLAAFKVPQEVVVRADLPKTPTGKIQRRVLRDENQTRKSG